jgi:bifunctional DNA-binding transcriptional regulator/antitoxin component of YhaV-PrlF toxin-antitoxin module
MNYVATITSKRQLTIPSKLFKKAKLSKGDKLLIKEESGELKIKKASSIVEEMAGSLSIPKRFRTIKDEVLIKKAKAKYYKKKFDK